MEIDVVSLWDKALVNTAALEGLHPKIWPVISNHYVNVSLCQFFGSFWPFVLLCVLTFPSNFFSFQTPLSDLLLSPPVWTIFCPIYLSCFHLSQPFFSVPSNFPDHVGFFLKCQLPLVLSTVLLLPFTRIRATLLLATGRTLYLSSLSVTLGKFSGAMARCFFSTIWKEHYNMDG